VQEHPGTRFYVCSVCGAYHTGHIVKTRKLRPNRPHVALAEAV
jgi:hypothetical protein